MPINENTLEQAIISELQEKGYEHVYGPDIVRDYHEVILEDCFRASMLNINPCITQAIITEAYKAIRNLGLLKLEDLNASFHKYLVEGIPVPYKKDGEDRTYTVRLIDFETPENNDFKVINQYTKRDQDKIPDIGIAYSIAMAKLEIMRDFFYGFSYAKFFGDSDMDRLKTIADGVEFALAFEDDESKEFIREATALSQAETLCRSLINEHDKREIEFFKCVKAGLCKIGGKGKVTSNEINARIMKMLE